MGKGRDSSIIVLSLSVMAVFFTANYHVLLTVDVASVTPFLTIMHLLLLRPLFLYIKENDLLKSGVTQKNFFILWITFGLLVFLSELYMGQVMEGVFFLYLVPLIYFMGLERIYSINEMHLLHIISSFPFVLVAGLFVATKHVFSTNSIALIVLFVGISLLCLEKEVIRRLKFIHFIFYQVILGMVFLILAGINSRTSMLTFLIAYAVNAVFNLIWLRKKKSDNKEKGLYYIFYIIVLIIGLIGVYLILGKLDKVLYKWGSDFSSNRFTIWGITAEKAEILGRGYEFFTGTPDPDPLKFGYSLKGPHNILFGILGYSGILAALVFIIILVKYTIDIVLNFDLKNVLYNNRDTVIFGTAFLFSGLLEGLLQFPFYRPANLIWLFILGSFYFSKNHGERISAKSHKISGFISEAIKSNEGQIIPFPLMKNYDEPVRITLEENNIDSGIISEDYITDDEKNRSLGQEKLKRSYFKAQLLWLVFILITALVSVIVIPGDGNLLGILKVLSRYMK